MGGRRLGGPLGDRRLFRHELMRGKTLRVEQGGEVAMIDPRLRGGGDRGLGVISDAEACGLQHGEIVGAVADGQRFLRRELVRDRQFLERGELGGLAQNRLGDPSGEASALDQQGVGAVLVEADGLADARGENA